MDRLLDYFIPPLPRIPETTRPQQRPGQKRSASTRARQRPLPPDRVEMVTSGNVPLH